MGSRIVRRAAPVLQVEDGHVLQGTVLGTGDTVLQGTYVLWLLPHWASSRKVSGLTLSPARRLAQASYCQLSIPVTTDQGKERELSPKSYLPVELPYHLSKFVLRTFF